MQKPVAPIGHSALQRISRIEITVVDSSTVFASPITRHLRDWWLNANDGEVPLRRQFDITEHAVIAPNVFLVEVLGDGSFRFKVVGEEVIRMIGRNNTGQRVTSSETTEVGHALEEYYHSIVRERVSKLCKGSLAFAYKDYWRFESLDCPLTADGERIDFIIGVMALVS
jgi:hypothetical protein